MDSIIKFRIKKTKTPAEDLEMEQFLSFLKESYNAGMQDFDDIFYTEYHIDATWKHHANIIEAIKSKAVGRPYLFILE